MVEIEPDQRWGVQTWLRNEGSVIDFWFLHGLNYMNAYLMLASIYQALAGLERVEYLYIKILRH